MRPFHLSIGSKSVEKSIQFFTEVLPGRITHQDDSGYVNIELFGAHITLKNNPEVTPNLPDFHFGFNLSIQEFDQLAENILSKNRQWVSVEPKVVDAGTPLERKKMYLKSPTGYIVELKGYGLNQYQESGLRNWHESVVSEKVDILEKHISEIDVLYEDEFQVIGNLKTTDFQIRLATPKDAKGIAKVHVDSWRETYRGIMPDKILDELSYEQREKVRREHLITNDPSYCCYVAEIKDDIIGFTVAGPRREGNEDYSGEIYAIYVLKKHHGDGIGKALFLETAKWLTLNNHDSMLIWVLTENPTVGFYEHMGGKRLDTKKIEIGEPLDEVSYGWPCIQETFD